MRKKFFLLACLLLFPPLLLAYEPTIPQAVVFNTCLVEGPSGSGHFKVACRALSKYAKVPVMIRIDGGDELVIKGKRVLRGCLKKGEAAEFYIECKRQKSNSQAVLHIELRFRYPYKAMRKAVQENAYGRYSTKDEIDDVINELNSLQSAEETVWTLDRAIILD